MDVLLHMTIYADSHGGCSMLALDPQTKESLHGNLDGTKQLADILLGAKPVYKTPHAGFETAKLHFDCGP